MKISAILLFAALTLMSSCDIMPRNTLKDCQAQCKDNKKTEACYDFCDCIHNQGHTLDQCLDLYNNAPEDTVRIR